MITVDEYAGRTVAVMGLGRSGEVTAAALRAGGARVIAWDDDAEARRRNAGLDLRDLTQLPPWRDGVAAMVLSPGIPYTHPAPHPAVIAARAARTAIIGDITLLARAQPEARRIGITGSNGKSTTTALLGHVLAATTSGPVAVGGNLGPPALALTPLGGDGLYVLELSSYQLDLVDQVRFHGAILLNITPDHLDRHGGLTGYIAAKTRIFAAQTTDDLAVIGVDDAPSATIAAALRRMGQRVVLISVTGPVAGGVWSDGSVLIDDTQNTAQPVLRLRDIPALPGAHNAQNLAAVWALARGFGLDPAVVAAAIRTWPGLSHRLEQIAVVDGVRFINDSKATNAAAAAWALRCHDAIHWIAGGVEKQGGYAAILPLLYRVRRAFLIGQGAASIARTLADLVPCQQCGDLPTAVAAAFATARVEARNGDAPVILLSPACASFDQFRDFSERGDRFRQLAHAIAAASTQERRV